eukprot:14033499-Alexandrium_andersonii.AAC.1
MGLLRLHPVCFVKASSPKARRPSRGGHGKALSAVGRWLVVRPSPTCYDLADVLVHSALGWC